MNPAELKSIRQRAGLSQSGLARVLRIEDGRSVRRWEAGDRAISGSVAIILEMLDTGELPERYLTTR